ncbi:hypothetical protein, partial [Bathymodiolus azoricus thioautotrophic gill symbiont]|uniref:hypothetical protein n=1 Tax=Bathymodiolus azoricus thioautotrophic gill symbiont TaxID=235205 RepID=UPI0018A87878
AKYRQSWLYQNLSKLIGPLQTSKNLEIDAAGYQASIIALSMILNLVSDQKMRQSLKNILLY